MLWSLILYFLFYVTDGWDVEKHIFLKDCFGLNAWETRCSACFLDFEH